MSGVNKCDLRRLSQVLGSKWLLIYNKDGVPKGIMCVHPVELDVELWANRLRDFELLEDLQIERVLDLHSQLTELPAASVKGADCSAGTLVGISRSVYEFNHSCCKIRDELVRSVENSSQLASQHRTIVVFDLLRALLHAVLALAKAFLEIRNRGSKRAFREFSAILTNRRKSEQKST